MAPEELSPATRFDNLKMDSLDALNMTYALEEEFAQRGSRENEIDRKRDSRRGGVPESEEFAV